MNTHKGFTLTEIVLVLVIIGILVAVASPAYHNFTLEAQKTALLVKFKNLERALVGDPEAGIRGYVDDMGTVPGSVADSPGNLPLRRLTELVENWGGYPYDPVTQTGWNGPYCEPEDIIDPWGNYIIYGIWIHPTVNGWLLMVFSEGPEGKGDWEEEDLGELLKHLEYVHYINVPHPKGPSSYWNQYGQYETWEEVPPEPEPGE